MLRWLWLKIKTDLCDLVLSCLRGFFRYFGTKILVINSSIQNKSYEQELTDDLLAIIHYFSMKSYSHRRQINKAMKQLKKDINKEEEN